MFKKAVLLILFASACLVTPAGAKRLTRGFKLSKMHLDLPVVFEDREIASSEVRRILTQRFSYLGKGAQCYAFLSEDENFVLKIFRFDQRHLFRIKKEKRSLEEKIAKFFLGCRIAFEEAAEETGLIYLHLEQGSENLPLLHARGPLCRPFHLPLDQYRFALQKKAEPLMEGLFEAKVTGRVGERIDAIVALLESRIKKRIGNTDPSLWRNFGFLGDRAIEIDFGNFTPRFDFSDATVARAELERYMRPLRAWLEKNAPEALPDLNARLERVRL